MDELEPSNDPGTRLRRRDSSVSEDYNIQATNDEAAECKRAAVHLGYWEDPFLEVFFHQKVDKKDPEINRGYWARVRGIRILVDSFLKVAGKNAQIVNLGCGFDTLFWQLQGSNAEFCNFTDVDFSSVTAKKIHFILKRASPLKDFIATNDEELKPESDHTDLHGPKYHLVGADLRQKKELYEKLMSAGLDREKPTVFVSECVLVYMSTDLSEKLLRELGDWFPTSLFINYEQVNLSDKFGSIMKENLHSRGICLAGMKACYSLEEQKKRYENAGWQSAKAWAMDTVFREFLPKEEVKRIESLEFLDEAELLWQLLQHYCISIASKDSQNLKLEDIAF